VFLLCYHQSTGIYEQIEGSSPLTWILQEGLFANSFPVIDELGADIVNLPADIVDISDNFNKAGKVSPFQNAGIMINGVVSTVKVKARDDSPQTNLNSVLVDDADVGPEFYIERKDLKTWEYLKGGKKEERITKEGYRYHYSEGNMVFPDDLTKPSRTIITGEGGKSPSRFKHVVTTAKGLRRLTPVVLERLNMFPDNHTLLDGITDAKRAFFMGNALVVGVVRRIAEVLCERIEG
jgi:DNA (cytosine-5)-methyltransferase 1